MARASPLDSELVNVVKRIVLLESTAFVTFCSMTRKPLEHVAARLLGNECEAQEVVQEVFCQFWTVCHTYDPIKGRVMTWLHRMTTNRCIDIIRRRKVAKIEFDIDVEQCDEVASMADPFDDLMLIQLRKDLSVLLNKLPPKYLSAILLHYYEDLSFQEASLKLGVPANTVKTWARRGITALRTDDLRNLKEIVV